MSYAIPDPRWEEPNLLIPGVKPTGPVAINRDNDIGRHIATDSVCIINPPSISEIYANEIYNNFKMPVTDLYTNSPYVGVNDRGNIALIRESQGGGGGANKFGLVGQKLSSMTTCTFLFVGARLYRGAGQLDMPIYKEARSGYISGLVVGDDFISARVTEMQYGDERGRKIAISTDDETTHGYAFVWRGGAVMDSYVDGAVSGTDESTEDVSSTWNDVTPAASVFTDNTYTHGASIEVLVYLPNVAISEASARSWTLDPYQFLQPA